MSVVAPESASVSMLLNRKGERCEVVRYEAAVDEGFQARSSSHGTELWKGASCCSKESVPPRIDYPAAALDCTVDCYGQTRLERRNLLGSGARLAEPSPEAREKPDCPRLDCHYLERAVKTDFGLCRQRQTHRKAENERKDTSHKCCSVRSCRLAAPENILVNILYKSKQIYLIN